MKRAALTCAALLLLSPRLFAPWAAHLVVSPGGKLAGSATPKAAARFATEAAELARNVSVSPGGPNQLLITIKGPTDGGPEGKGYYLVICKRRLPADALDFRSALGQWKWRAGKELPPVPAEIAGVKINTRINDVIDVRPLVPTERTGEQVIACVLTPEAALRSYIAWDFKFIYERGGMVMDGGLWLTYDVPAFVEAAARKAPAAKRE